MKTILLCLPLVFCFSVLAAQQKPLIKPPFKALQQAKIVPKTAKGEAELLSDANILESSMHHIRIQQLQLQADMDALVRKQAEMRKNMEAMNELSESGALRLQMLADRQTAFLATLSNLLKKMNAAQKQLTESIR